MPAKSPFHLVSILNNPITSDQFDPESLKTEKLMVDPDLLMQLVLQVEAFGFWRVDVQTGQVWWSENVYHIHGMEPGDGSVNIGKAVSRYHPKDAKTVEFLVNDAITNKNGFNFVLRLNRADGKMRYVQSTASVELHEDGSVKSVYGIFRDVTERISQENISKTRAQLVNSIISNSPSPIVILDRNLRYLQISPAWAKFHNLENPKSFIGTSHYEALPEIPPEWRAEHQRALKGEVIQRSTALQAGRKTGSTLFGSVVFPWHTASGEVGGLIIMVTAPGNETMDGTGAIANIARLMGQTDPKSHRFGEIR